jgi:hypothetical protein
MESDLNPGPPGHKWRLISSFCLLSPHIILFILIPSDLFVSEVLGIHGYAVVRYHLCTVDGQESEIIVFSKFKKPADIMYVVDKHFVGCFLA